MITLEQAAQQPAISRRTLERFMAAGEFPAPFKLGHSARVEVADVDAYCASCEHAVLLARIQRR